MIIRWLSLTALPGLPAALPTSQLILQPFSCSPTSQFILKPFFRFSYVTSSLLILQPFRHFTYVTTHFPTLPSLYLRHSSFSNPSVALPTLQIILQPFFRFSYVTNSSLKSPGEPPMALIQNDIKINSLALQLRRTKTD